MYMCDTKKCIEKFSFGDLKLLSLIGNDVQSNTSPKSV